MTPDRLIGIGALARVIHVSARTIRGWIDCGKVVGERTLTGRYQIPASEFHRIVELAREKRKIGR